jgi:hypothetical protein
MKARDHRVLKGHSEAPAAALAAKRVRVERRSTDSYSSMIWPFPSPFTPVAVPRDVLMQIA